MTDNQIIQMHDYAGNNQYPVTLASLVYDEDGETVAKKLALLLDWFEWGDEKETSVKTKYPFWSEKQLSAGGIGEEGGSGEGGIGTITGIKVNGAVWNEPDELGVLTIPDYPTSLEWADISGRPTHLSQFTDDVVAGKYLPLSGGTIESAGIPLTVKRTNNPYSVISFYGTEDGTSQHLGYLGFSGVGEPIYMTSGGSERILIHSGNIGEYAVMEAEAASTFVLKFVNSTSGIDFNSLTSGGMLTNYYGPSIWRNAPSGMSYGAGINFKPSGYNSLSGQLAWDVNHASTTDTTRYLWWRADDDHAFANAKWHQIAFTDSTVAAAKRIVNDNGDFVIYRSGSGNIIVGDNNGAGDAHLLGNNIYLRYGGSATYGLVLNSSGNVLIGTTEEIGYKLDVRGSTHLDAYDGVSYVHIGPAAFGTKIQARSNGNTYFQSQRFDSTTAYYNIVLQELGGNVGIGTASPAYKLEVNGNAHIQSMLYMSDWIWFYSEGIYIHNSGIAWHDTTGNYRYALLGFASDKINLHQNTVLDSDRTLTIGSAVLSWDSVNNALKIAGNVYTTGQFSAGGVGTEVQKVFDIAEASNTTTANQPYTATLTHNLNTYDLAVVVYEVEETYQTDGTKTEKLTQVLADVTLTDENKVEVYFASRKIDKKYRIVIIG